MTSSSPVSFSNRIESLFDVSGRHVLITGGSRGIGFMIAQGFVENGAHVWISARTKDACEEAVARLTARGPGKAQYIPCDLSQTTEPLVAAFQTLPLDILVNNAGTNWNADLDTFPDAAFDKVMRLNVRSVFLLTRDMIPALRRSRYGGRVIMVGSVDGIRVPLFETYPYSASKASLHHMTRVLANRLGPEGITVNCIAPGPFESKMMAKTLKEFKETILSGIPLGRIGDTADVAAACIYLSGRGGEYVTGVVLPVDGGLLVSAKM